MNIHNKEEAVLIHLKLSDGDLGNPAERERICELEDRMEEAIALEGVGEFDGDEFGQGECVLFMYGADADALFNTIEPILRGSGLCSAGYAIRRYGAPGASENRIAL